MQNKSTFLFLLMKMFRIINCKFGIVLEFLSPSVEIILTRFFVCCFLGWLVHFPDPTVNNTIGNFQKLSVFLIDPFIGTGQMTLEGRETAEPQWWKVGSHKSVGYFGWGQCSMMLSSIFIEVGFNQPLPIWSLSFADGKLWTLVTWPVFYEG